MRKLTLIFALSLIVSACFLGCKDDERFENCEVVIPCTEVQLASESVTYDSLPLEDIKVNRVSFDENFMLLNLRYGSCQKSKMINLYVLKSLTKPLPVHHDAKLILEPQPCEALKYFNQKICIDRSSIPDGAILNLQLRDTIMQIHLPKIK